MMDNRHISGRGFTPSRKIVCQRRCWSIIYSMVSLIVTRHIEVRSIPAKATLTGLMEELWLKFEGKERWIKSLQMGNNLLEKYFY